MITFWKYNWLRHIRKWLVAGELFQEGVPVSVQRTLGSSKRGNRESLILKSGQKTFTSAKRKKGRRNEIEETSRETGLHPEVWGWEHRRLHRGQCLTAGSCCAVSIRADPPPPLCPSCQYQCRCVGRVPANHLGLTGRSYQGPEMVACRPPPHSTHQSRWTAARDWGPHLNPCLSHYRCKVESGK